MRRSQFRSRHAAAALLLAVVALVFLLGNFRHAGTDDAVPTVLTADALVSHGRFWLDDFDATIRARRAIGELPNMAEEHGHYVTPYATGSALLAVPVFAADRLLFGRGEATGMDAVDHCLRLGRTAAALLGVMAAAALYGALAHLYGRRVALWGAAIYAFGTPLWFLSQALWQHVPFQAMLCIALWLMASAPGRGRLPLAPGRLFLVGFALAMALVCRYSNLVIIVPIGLWVAWKSRGTRLLALAGGGLLPTIYVLWFHNHHFGSPFRQGLPLGYFAFNLAPWWGAVSLLFNPSFGLIVSSPVLFAIAAWTAVRRAGKGTARRQVMLLALLASAGLFALMSTYNAWFGGYSFSSRMLSDAVPCLILAFGQGIRGAISGGMLRRIILVASLGFGVAINVLGVYTWDQTWNAKFDKGVGDQRWMWTLRNNLPWYQLRRGAFYVPARIAKGLDSRVVRLWMDPEQSRGWNAPENWGGSVVRWSRLESTEKREAGATVRYLVGHKDLDARPLTIRVTDQDGREIHRNEPKAPGEFTFTLPNDKDYSLTWLVSRQQEAPGDSRVLGVAVYDVSEIGD